jgi:hypothetical protein
VSSSDQHDLVLGVTLGNDQSFEFHIQFSMTGFPSGTVNSADQGWASASALSDGVSKGRPFFVDSVTNPTGHPLTLWVRLGDGAGLKLQTRLHYNGWQAQNTGPNPIAAPGNCVTEPNYPTMVCHPLPYQWSTISTAPMEVSSATVSGSQSMTLTDLSEWRAIPIAARATVSLNWQASATPGTSSCQGSGNGAQEVQWDEVVYGQVIPDPVDQYHFKHHDDLFPESWSTEGAELSGNWTRELRLSEIDVTADEIQNLDKQSPDLQARVMELPAGMRGEEIQVGLPPLLISQPDSCQGTF